MGFLSMFRRIDRKSWYVCSNCMMLTSHDTIKSVFYHGGPPVLVQGRSVTPCPRCASTNTRSFLEIKDDGSKSAIWGLERLVRKYPRSHFEIKSAGEASARS